MSTLRFHWDFLGPDAKPTAEHFCHHVEEFCQTNGVASLECDEKHMLLVRDRLLPKRAERLVEP